MGKKTILQWLDEHNVEFTEIAQKIWDHPQIAYKETYASDLQKSVLHEKGFTITSSVAGIPTAFVAEFGSGTPIIGLMGEYDALPGLSQKASAIKEEVVLDGPGHGCGHNLLGTAGVEAVIALKETMAMENVSGTIRYYGCPAEEVLSGKTFMAREGVFDDLDCALTWHPGKSNIVVNMSMQAMVSIKYHFKGITAHAAAAPHAGRSALDAVELMNTGSNYLREHILDGSRIHYVITNGGLAPNIVPEDATVWYYLRASSREHVEDMLRRVNKIAEGSALMTETKVSSEIIANVYEMLPNNTISEVMLENMNECGVLEFTQDEQNFAQEIVNTIDPGVVRNDQKITGGTEVILPVKNFYFPHMKGTTGAGSSDVADISWIAPMGMVTTTCAPAGVQFHSWQATASFGSSIGYKGMHFAAKTMALTGYDLLINKNSILEKAKKEFLEDIDGKPYKAGIPNEVKPPVQ
ncbi:aminobenzoyl-glutamate utilization protein B [Virgibacillus halotolerans]|uniref:amidohydrolase n=1 Tax=Virgibacillus halotolerans TaxID=1071053 RepID=UPI001961E758|nr:amidohydrolase [Virgibacillus halotolerans]MBM7599962.1 aminobenzoyl-glutamate utilization protein B [Virgibacillus halotolerans]